MAQDRLRLFVFGVHAQDMGALRFRRRQVASRAATISEALSSIMWAGTAVLFVGDQWLALLPGILAVVVLAVAWAISPKGKRV